MSTEETTIFNEGATENVAMNNNQGAQPDDQKAPEEKVMEQTEKTADKQPAAKGGWQQVVIGGVSGILLGGAGVFFSSAVSATDDPDAPTAATGGHSGDSVPVSEDVNVMVEGLPVATVSDDMSFAEAFAAARAEVGAGGVFEWHGGVYGTYYAEEWNSMTPEEQQVFGSHISYNGSSSSHSQQAEGHVAQNQTSHAAAQHEEEGESSEEEPGEEDGGQQQQEIAENTTHGGGSQNTDTQDTGTGTQDSGDDDGEVQVLDVSEVTLEDGSAVTVGQLTVDGQEVLVVDVDQDGTFDLLAMDVNQDGEITSDEMTNIQEDNLTVDALQQAMEAQEASSNLYADNLPDYTNDADTSSFA